MILFSTLYCSLVFILHYTNTFVGYLDVARRTYSETIDDIAGMWLFTILKLSSNTRTNIIYRLMYIHVHGCTSNTCTCTLNLNFTLVLCQYQTPVIIETWIESRWVRTKLIINSQFQCVHTILLVNHHTINYKMWVMALCMCTFVICISNE